MEGRVITAKMIAEFKEHLILEERSVATIQKYIRDVKAFMAYAQNSAITKETVIAYTPCTDLSSSSIELSNYGWGKNIWKNEKLKKALFQIARIERGSTFVVAQKTSEMKSVCEKASLKKNFHKSRDIERIAIFKGRYNEFLSICYHIRNSFAHGRLAMYDCKNGNDIMFVLEDGVKKNGEFQVRSR